MHHSFYRILSPVSPIICYTWQKLHEPEYSILSLLLANLRNSRIYVQPVSCIFPSS